MSRLFRSLPTLALPALLAVAGLAAAHEDSASASPALSNPQTSLILNGVYYADDARGAGTARLGSMAGILVPAPGADQGLAEGFNLGDSELGLSATVDPYLDAYANITFSTNSVSVEEAAFTTRALPAGWQVKAGRFKSGFGYQNSRHAHAWDFADQNLPYASMIAPEGLSDNGIQVTWLPATDTYMQLGAEALQGDQDRFGAAVDLNAVAQALAVNVNTLPPLDRHGPQLFTGFFRVAPDLGPAGALQLGVSAARHSSEQELQQNGANLLYASGSATLLDAEAVWKRSATGAYGRGSAHIQAEYLHLAKDMAIDYDTVSADTGKAITGKQDGFYVQGVYGFASRWEAGLRYDVNGHINETQTAGVPAQLGESSRVTADVTFRPSEFSYFRLQLADASVVDATGNRDRFAQLLLQYNLSLGVHGAHSF